MSKYKLIGWSSFEGGTPEPDILKNITHDKTVYACWEEEKPYGKITPEGEILDTWEEIALAVDDGVYTDVYEVGNYKSLDLGSTYGTVRMEIVAFDADDLADGSGKGPITWISKELLKGTYKWKNTATSDNSGGYPSSYIKTVVETAITQVVGEDPRSYIKAVNKTYRMGSDEGGATKNSNYSVWVPSAREICGWDSSASSWIETSGPIYNDKFKDSGSILKAKNGYTNNPDIFNAEKWYLRSALYSTNDMALRVLNLGCIEEGSTSSANGIPIGFCTGGTPIPTPYPGPVTNLKLRENSTSFNGQPVYAHLTWEDPEDNCGEYTKIWVTSDPDQETIDNEEFESQLKNSKAAKISEKNKYVTEPLDLFIHSNVGTYYIHVETFSKDGSSKENSKVVNFEIKTPGLDLF